LEKRRLLAIFVALFLLAPIPSAIRVKAQAEKLVLVGPVYTREADMVMKGFKEYYKRTFGKDIDVSYLHPGGWPVCVDKVRSWRGHPDADVFFGAGAPAHEVLKAEGLVIKYKPKDWDKIPLTWHGMLVKDPEGYWTPFSLWLITNIYNEEVVKMLGIPVPKTWDDLLKPIYRGLIVHTLPYASGTMHETCEVILQSRGWDKGWAYLRRLAVNLIRFSTGSTDTTLIVERGEAAIGVAQPQMNAMMARADGYPVKAIVPDVTILVPESVAILKNAPHLKNAKIFVDWLLSMEGQKYVLMGGYFPARKDFNFSDYVDEIPMAKHAIEAIGVDNFYKITGVKILAYNLTLAKIRWDKVNDYYEKEIYRKWDELKDTWWNYIIPAQEAIKAAQQKGMDVTQALSKLNIAMAAFDKGELAKARSFAQEALSLVKG